jgi:hypothetical protein
MLETDMKMKLLALDIFESRDELATQIYAMLNPSPVISESGEPSTVQFG